MNFKDGMKYVMRNWNRLGIKMKGMMGEQKKISLK